MRHSPQAYSPSSPRRGSLPTSPFTPGDGRVVYSSSNPPSPRVPSHSRPESWPARGGRPPSSHLSSPNPRPAHRLTSSSRASPLPDTDTALTGSGDLSPARGSPDYGAGPRTAGSSPVDGRPRGSRLAWPDNLEDELRALGDYARAVAYFDEVLRCCTPAARRGEAMSKAYLAMGNVAKQLNFIDEARQYYSQACIMWKQLQTAWCTAAKLEEELGRYGASLTVVEAGIRHCPQSYLLLRKRVELLEILEGPERARGALAQLTWDTLERTWKVWSYGAQMEARHGRSRTAIFIFGCLRRALRPTSQHLPRLCEDMVRLRERLGLLPRALALAATARELPGQQNGLWLASMHLQERAGHGLDALRRTAAMALEHISHDVQWKLHFTLGQMEARAGNLGRARACLFRAVQACSLADRWKVWQGGARVELASGNVDTAERLLLYALQQAPAQRHANVITDLARLAEFCDDYPLARRLLAVGLRHARASALALQLVQLELRAGRMWPGLAAGLERVVGGDGSGRLWAQLIQGAAPGGIRLQQALAVRAVNAMAKSGEVWCELARIATNPLSPHFNIYQAQAALATALHYTPQYGDSFLECLRLELLYRGPSQALRDLTSECIHAAPNYGALWHYCRAGPLSDARSVIHHT